MLIAAEYCWLHDETGQRAGRGSLHPDMAAEITDGRVTALRPLGRDTPDRRVHVLMPGCADLQVNGGGGVMLNSDPTPAGMRAIRAAHARLGTTRIMPTVITDHPEVTEAAARAAIACKDDPGILGLHIEGPHINPIRKGTHDPALIRPLDGRMMDLLADLRTAGVRVILTLAPELADPADLARIRAMGVVISAGHTMATAAQARAALAQGVGMFTHLFNAMPQMSSREPGVIAAAILSDAWCGIIADGIHVDWDMLRIALAARPHPDRCFLVSDAMATVGGPDSFTLYGHEIHVRDGRLVNAGGALAGAHIDMVTSLANIHRHAGVPLEQAIAMATDIPCAAIGAPPVRMTGGIAIKELIALDADLALTPLG
ncbi:MAG: amidohydrolase family protein [Paracoccus sp. (in: a-proteobacteria)]|nr:amidohydrolase family protein [Paracoccus sp. (in: a-proteobacteria)]